MDGAETEGSPRALSEAASDVPGAAKVAVHDVSASRSAASTQPPLDLRTIGQHLMASTDTGSFQRQLQQTTPLRHHDATIAEQPSWLSGSGGRLAASGITLDSSASAAVRHPSISLAAPALSSHTFPRQDSVAGGSKAFVPLRTEKTSFLVQQPSSKLWMEAVPMRVGTKATTTYRVYSNAFMEGRQQESRMGRSTARSGIPSIQSSSVMFKQPSWQPRSATMASSGPPPRQDTSRRGAPEPAIARRIQPGPVQRQASFELKQYGHAVADRMMQRGYVVRPRREDLTTESQELAVSAASTADMHHQASASISASRRHDSGSPPGALSEAATKKAAATMDQERQLAALLSMPELSSASLLSSAEAQGSSNLIYILKTLQDHGGMNPQRLLQQLQAAMKDSPMQQALLMHMLQESLAAPSQAQTQAPKRQESEVRDRDRERHRRESLQERYKEPDRPAAPTRHADLAATQQRPTPKRISHEEMEASMRRMSSDTEQLAAPSRGLKSASLSRLSREPAPEPARHSRAPPLQGQPAEERAAQWPVAAPQPHQPSATLPRLVFKDATASSEQQKRLNPFEGLRMQQYKAAAKEADAAARPARPAAAHATESPASTDAGREPAQQAAGPVPPSTTGMQPAAARPKEDNLREAAKMLLCLNSTEPVARGEQTPPQDGDSVPATAAASAEAPAAADEPAEAGNTATVSPLQALVQDIMQQQKQRAQESALAKLPSGLSRVERRGGDRQAALASDEEAFPAPAPAPGRKRMPRMMGLNSVRDTRGPAAMEEVGPMRDPSGSRLNVLGFAVPSAPRTGHIARDPAQPHVELPPPTRYPGYGAVQEGSRRRPSGSMGESSGGRSEPGGPSALSGASAERRISHSLSGRRVTRPILHESSVDFSEESSGEVHSTDSESWDTSKEPRHRRRRRKR